MVLTDGATHFEKEDFVSEIALMKRIGKNKHPHVVGLLGCVTVPEPLCIILEYLEYGNLLTYLQSVSEEVKMLIRLILCNMLSVEYTVCISYWKSFFS